MNHILIVPTYIDALVLDKPTPVIDSFANFSRSPYFDGDRDVNPDVANISEDFLTHPFQNQNLYLGPGVHLHWALPDVLTRGTKGSRGKTEFPAVPNRWLVTRIRNEKLEEQWVVESDYYYNPTNSTGSDFEANGSITYPYIPSQYKPPNNEVSFQYGYLGKVLRLEDWKPQNEAKNDYLSSITAVGYGEPTFAACYPNCHSVFGFWDHLESEPKKLPGVTYEILGWYSDSSQDYLFNWIEKFRNSGDFTHPLDEQLTALEKSNHWKITEPNDKQILPNRMVCYARIKFGDKGSINFQPDKDHNVPVSIGNTSTEALSAYLAHELDESRKSSIEDQLEALHLATGLDHRRLDVGPKFLEARHTKGFRPVPAGSIWTLRPDHNTQSVQTNSKPDDLTLPIELAGLLNELNNRQQAYDQALFEMESLSQQLYADWYKYMLCAYPPLDTPDDYPDVDEVLLFIENYGIDPFDQKLGAIKELEIRRDDAINALKESDAMQDLQSLGHKLILRQTPAPRFWEPNDPVVLLTGDLVRHTDRHGATGEHHEDGLLNCIVASVERLEFDNVEGLTAIRNEITSQAGTLGQQVWVEQPWNPILFEWEVEFFPVQEGNNLDSSNLSYNPDFITKNYKLPANSADFSRAAGNNVVRAAQVYSGRSIITPHAKNQLKLRLEEYLKKAVLDEYYLARNIDEKDRKLSLLCDQIQDLLSWYSSSPVDFSDPMYTAMQAYQKLCTTNVLAQSLGGFNQALIMHKQTLQFPIADPIGFKDYRGFTDQVRDRVGNNNLSAPQPLNNFSPIRAGEMKILRLRLIDTFGQVRELNFDEMTIVSETMSPKEGDSNSIWLLPRIVQPARLNFRWLAAEGKPSGMDEAEMNDHPATSPICGWILPNNLDGSLMVYEQNGKPLGSLDQNVSWQPAPGGKFISIRDIPNPHLRKLVSYFSKQGETFHQQFLFAVENALEHIDPDNFNHNEALALLLGRPIAVVRASLNLELRGRPAINQDWTVFRQDMQKTATEKDSQGIEHLARTRDDFTKVNFPIRIGEHLQLNDGLIGYWVEAGDEYAGDKFYAPQTSIDSNIPHRNIQVHQDDNPAMILQSFEDPPHTITILLDPRGVLHATCGILPTKAIQIPADQFADALRAIEVTFLTAPVLTGLGKIALPVPDEAGYEWSWLEKENGVWADDTQIVPVNLEATFATKQVIREGWLKLRRKLDDQNSNP